MDYALAYLAGIASGVVFCFIYRKATNKPVPERILELYRENSMLTHRALVAEAILDMPARELRGILDKNAKRMAESGFVETAAGPVRVHNPEAAIRAAGAPAIYCCKTCGHTDRKRYVYCNHPLCPDGRDQ